jgi:hypothetical protein
MWKDNSEIYVRNVGCDSDKWIRLAQDKIKVGVFVKREKNI